MGSIKQDRDLKYGSDNWRETLEKFVTIVDKRTKLAMDPYPIEKVLVDFADLAYTNCDCTWELNLSMPEGWELLTTAWNDSLNNGYFGCAFFNPSEQQVAVCHRGTDPTNIGALRVDCKSVYFDKSSDHMYSAITFVDDVKEAILKTNTEHGCCLELSISGHSLGAWLAGITAMTVKYLKKTDSGFRRIENPSEGIHAHTLAIDSPGVDNMMMNICREYDDRCTRSMHSEHLDITTIFAASNIVNCSGFHVGDIYQLEGVHAHSLDNFIRAYNEEIKKHSVLDWPEGIYELGMHKELMKEYESLNSNAAQVPPENSSVSDQNIEPIEENLLETPFIWKYRTKPWNGNICKLGVFSRKELHFLETWKLFQNRIKLNPTYCEKFLSNHFLKEFVLPMFMIDTHNNTIICESMQHLGKVIGQTKQLLRWFPREVDALIEDKALIKSVSVYELGQKYLLTLPDILDCQDTFGLKTFLESPIRILQILINDCDLKLEAARLNNIFTNINNSLDAIYSEKNHHVFLSWKDITSIASNAIEDLTMSDVTKVNLLVFDFASSTDDLSQNNDILRTVISYIQTYSYKKLVIILSREIDPQILIDLTFDIKPFKAFELSDLTLTSIEEIYNRDAIVLGKEILSLKTLLGDTSNNERDRYKINELISPIFKKLATKHPYIIAEIPIELQMLCELDALCFKGNKLGINEQVSKERLTTLLERDDGPLLVISDPDQLYESYWGEVAEDVRGRIFDDVDGQELFMEKCRMEPCRVIYCFRLCVEGLTLTNVYNRGLYMPRKFPRFVIKSINEFVRSDGNGDVFMFNQEEDKSSLISSFQISREAEELFVSQDRFKILNRSQEMNSIDSTEEELLNKHYFEKMEIGGRPHLVWKSSRGSLNGLRPFIKRDFSDSIGEDAYSNTRNKMDIIADHAGTGKTTSLTRMSELIPDFWVLRILNENLISAIENLPSIFTLQSVTKCLIRASGLPPKNDILLVLLQKCLESNISRPVCVLMDALEEITEKENRKKTIELLQYLKIFTTCKIIVTIQGHPEELENDLTEFYSEFDKITRREQEDYMVNFWLPYLALELPEHGELEKGRLRRFYRELREEMEGMLGEDVASFVCIPLQIRTLAEEFLQPAIKYAVSPDQVRNSSKITNLYKLYKQLIEASKTLYFKQVTLSYNQKEVLFTEIIKKHCFLAFKAIGSEFAAEYFNRKDLPDQDTRRLGLIWSNANKTDTFIHSSFIKYFCADFLVQQLRLRMPENILLVKNDLGKFLLGSDYKLIRKFIETQLDISPIEGDTLENNLQMYKYWFEHKHELFFHNYNKTPLHIAVDEHNRHTVAVLLSCPSSRITEEAYIFFVTARDKAGRTALNIALENGNAKIVELITESVERCSYESILKLMLATFLDMGDDLFSEYYRSNTLSALSTQALIRSEQIRKEISPFMAAVRNNNYITVKNIFSRMENNTERAYLVSAIDSRGNTAINLAASKKDHTLFKLFAKQGVCVSYDKYEQSPLHCASEEGNTSIVDFLLNQSEETYDRIMISNFEKWNMSLLFLGINNNLDKEEIAFEHPEKYITSSSINSINNEGYTALHLAACRGHHDTVRTLLDRGAEIGIRNTNGLTASISAARSGHLEVVELLLTPGRGSNSSTEDYDSLITALYGADEDGQQMVGDLPRNHLEANPMI